MPLLNTTYMIIHKSTNDTTWNGKSKVARNEKKLCGFVEGKPLIVEEISIYHSKPSMTFEDEVVIFHDAGHPPVDTIFLS